MNLDLFISNSTVYLKLMISMCELLYGLCVCRVHFKYFQVQTARESPDLNMEHGFLFILA